MNGNNFQSYAIYSEYSASICTFYFVLFLLFCRVNLISEYCNFVVCFKCVCLFVVIGRDQRRLTNLDNRYGQIDRIVMSAG